MLTAEQVAASVRENPDVTVASLLAAGYTLGPADNPDVAASRLMSDSSPEQFGMHASRLALSAVSERLLQNPIFRTNLDYARFVGGTYFRG